jgi:hypothetical protein
MSDLELWYHGTPSYQKILDSGFDIEAERRHDPGDFGWGIYVVANLPRAKTYGNVLGVVFDASDCAYISNPYFIKGFDKVEPETEVEKLFTSIAMDDDWNMLTIRGSLKDRIRVCKEIRRVFLERGYTGIISDYAKGEAVIFDPDIIQDVFLLVSGD